jgi:deoxyribonuclease-1-like protein
VARKEKEVKTSRLLLLIAAVAGGWFALDHWEIRGIDDLPLLGKTASRQANADTREDVRIASLNLETLESTTLDNPSAVLILTEIIHRFDVVAVQGLSADQASLAQNLTDRLNQQGRKYHCLLGPPVGRKSPQRRFAYLFDEATVEIDHTQSYTIRDPDDLLAHPPLVAWFRTRGPSSDRAFTFTLVNVDVDAQHVSDEIAALQDAFFSVRDDGRGEDDVIMLGNFNADDTQLSDLTRLPGMIAVVNQTATNIEQTRQSDNILFQQPSTTEYLGHGGTLDFLRNHNLTLDQARMISMHLPVWSEFSLEEQTGNATLAETSAVSSLR